MVLDVGGCGLITVHTLTTDELMLVIVSVRDDCLASLALDTDVMKLVIDAPVNFTLIVSFFPAC